MSLRGPHNATPEAIQNMAEKVVAQAFQLKQYLAEIEVLKAKYDKVRQHSDHRQEQLEKCIKQRDILFEALEKAHPVMCDETRSDEQCFICEALEKLK